MDSAGRDKDPLIDEPGDHLLPYLRAVLAVWEYPDGHVEQELALFHRGEEAARHRDALAAAGSETERQLLDVKIEKQLIVPSMGTADDAPFFRGKRYPPKVNCVVFAWREPDGIHQAVQLCERKREADSWMRNLKAGFKSGSEELLALEIQVKPVPAESG